MKRIGLLAAALPASMVVMAACGGADNSLIGGGDDGGAETTTGDDGGGAEGSTGEGGGGEGGLIDGAGGEGGSDGSGIDAAPDAGMGPGTYVSGAIGLDTNPGTKALPVKTISKGIANAVALGGAASVYVAQGHYPEKVTLVEGISLLGGHQCDMNSCTWARDRVMYDTAIDMQDAEGVLAGATVTKATKIDGFRLRGLAGALNAVSATCLSLDGGSPTVTNNVVAPGVVTGSGRAVGIIVYAPTVDATGALIDSNTIQGGSSANVWVGITFDAHPGPPPASPGVAVVSNNKIRGGAAPVTSGINAFSCGGVTKFFKNDILAGTSMAPGGNNGTSWAIQAFGKATYDANTLNADQANVGTCQGAGLCGGFISYSSTSILTNNIIFGVKGPHTTAVLLSEAEMAAGVIVLNGNYLDGAGIGISSSGQTTSSALQLRNCGAPNCGVNTLIGKARNNILMGGLNQLRYGVYEEQLQQRTVHPQAFEYSDVFFSQQSGRTDVLYHFWNGLAATDLNTLVLITATVPTNPAPNNLYNVDPQVTATQHLVVPGSPMIDKGTLTEAPPKDIDGDTRPRGAAIDIGADEAM